MPTRKFSFKSDGLILESRVTKTINYDDDWYNFLRRPNDTYVLRTRST